MIYTLTATSSVVRDADGANIPADARNADWQIYQAWLAAGNTPTPYTPPMPSAAQAAAAQYAAALAAGLTLSWSTSTTLDGTYDIDPQTQAYISGEITSILMNGTFTNGQPTRVWLDAASAPHTFSIAQFKAFATQVALTVDALLTAQATAAAGGSATWPSASATIAL